MDCVKNTTNSWQLLPCLRGLRRPMPHVQDRTTSSCRATRLPIRPALCAFSSPGGIYLRIVFPHTGPPSDVVSTGAHEFQISCHTPGLAIAPMSPAFPACSELSVAWGPMHCLGLIYLSHAYMRPSAAYECRPRAVLTRQNPGRVVKSSEQALKR